MFGLELGLQSELEVALIGAWLQQYCIHFELALVIKGRIELVGHALGLAVLEHLTIRVRVQKL